MRKNNSVKLIGNAVADVRMIGDSGKVGILRIAVDVGNKEVKKTMFVNIKLFDDTLRDIQYFDIQKGNTVCVEGRIADDEFDATDGTKVKTFEVIADNIHKVARPEKTGPSF